MAHRRSCIVALSLVVGVTSVTSQAHAQQPFLRLQRSPSVHVASARAQHRVAFGPRSFAETDRLPAVVNAGTPGEKPDTAPLPLRPPMQRFSRADEAGTTYGIFVGISRYAGENSDLMGTAEDARQLARAFEQTGWMLRRNAIVLTDERATLDRVRQAFRTFAPRVGPADTLVFFYDGHGGARALDLRGEDLSRHELDRLLGEVRGRSLIVLDSCKSGGFAEVVRNRPDRAGLFSSRADQNSQVATEVGAGGWLAYNFLLAVKGGVHRRADGSMDFDDVVRFVHRDYAARRLPQTLVAVRGGPGFSLGGARDPVLRTPRSPDWIDERVRNVGVSLVPLSVKGARASHERGAPGSVQGTTVVLTP